MLNSNRLALRMYLDSSEMLIRLYNVFQELWVRDSCRFRRYRRSTIRVQETISAQVDKGRKRSMYGLPTEVSLTLYSSTVQVKKMLSENESVEFPSTEQERSALPRFSYPPSLAPLITGCRNTSLRSLCSYQVLG